MPLVTPIRTTDFISSIGVNTHIAYTDGDYGHYATVISDLEYLGINHVRDAIPNAAIPGWGWLNYSPIAAGGIKFDFLFGGADTGLTETISRLHAFASAHPGSIASLEGLNEVNNWPISYGSLTGNAAALAFQADLYRALKSDPVLGDLPVYNLTSWPTLIGPADAFNVHLYPGNGDQPLETLKSALALRDNLAPNARVVITEAGYFTLPGGGTWEGVDEATQAKLSLNLLLDAAKLGFDRTFLYQLLDAYPDPSGSDMERHFGLFDAENRPKLAATAIHNLTTILRAGSAEPASFTSTATELEIAGLPAAGNSLLLQGSSGTHYLVLWNEPDIWNEASNSTIEARGTTVRVALGTTYSKISLFDPLVSSASLSSRSNTNHVDVLVSDHPVILELKGPSSGHPGGGLNAGTKVPDSNLQPAVADLFGSIAHDTSGSAGQVHALYDAILDRPPDPLGYEFWLSKVKHGTPLRDVAAGLLASEEARAHVGSSDNRRFVEELYETALHRQGEISGVEHHLTALNGGSSRAEVAIGFALSTENEIGMSSAFASGVFAPDKDAADVARLYYGIFDRAPDAGGLSYWTSQVESGTSLREVAARMLDTPEFTASHPGLSNAQFVTSLYEHALDRAPDPGGFQFWTTELASGLSRADVALGLSESVEAQHHHLAQIEQGWQLS
jgi:hypothetical protein